MYQNGQTHFKNLGANVARFLKCLNVLGHYAVKGYKRNVKRIYRLRVMKI